jgi:hypothetical protein
MKRRTHISQNIGDINTLKLTTYIHRVSKSILYDSASVYHFMDLGAVSVAQIIKEFHF